MEEQNKYELEDSIAKSIFMLNNMIDAYDLDSSITSKNDALAFGIMKHDIYMNVEIIRDYLMKARDAFLKLEVCA